MVKQAKKSVYNKALDLLSRQDYSISKITKKLESLGYQSNEISETIEKLEKFHLLNEEEYAKKRIQSFIQKGHGLKLININLEKEQVQVTEYLVQEVYQSMHVDCHEQIQRLIEKRCLNTKITSNTSHEEVYKLKQKLLRHLTSKGHDFELCQQLSNDYFSLALSNA
jgi:SOS response regulatory protein OraA/RecX